jgi:chitinase
MKSLDAVAVGLVTLVLALSPAPSASKPRPGSGGKRVVAYFAEWAVFGRNYHVADLPADQLTHVNYAFAQVKAGEIALVDASAATQKVYPGDKREGGALRGSFHQLQLLKKKHPKLRTLISIGGWTKSGGFSDAALTRESRTKFAKSCVRFLIKYGFDGVDVDWEFPVAGGLPGNKARPADKGNFTRMLAALRRELDARGKTDHRHYLLTIAAPATPGTYRHMELGKIHRHLDWINLMTYDLAGSWSKHTNFNAPLYASSKDPAPEAARKSLNVDAAVKGYRQAGVAADKIVVGVPFYGRGWAGVADVNHGLYQKPTAKPPRGEYQYRNVAAKYLGKYQRYWHTEAKVPWLFDPKAGVMITYDDPQSLRLKAEYVRQNRLGGVMIWEISQDDAKGSLLKALHRGLGQGK